MIFLSVCQIASRFLKPEKKTIDLVGNEKMKASTSVRHIALPCSRSARAQLIPDIIRCYSRFLSLLNYDVSASLLCCDVLNVSYNFGYFLTQWRAYHNFH